LMLFVIVVLNLIGLDIFAKVQTVFTLIMIATLLVLGVAGLFKAPESAVVLEPFNPMGWAVFSLIPLAIWAFMGAEFVCSLVEETIRPGRNIPLSMFLAIVIAFCVYVVFSGGVGVHLSREVLKDGALPHVLAAESIIGKAGLVWIGVAGIAATASSINSVLATAPRMLYGMAHAGQAPAFFQYLHPRFRTPWSAILALGLAMVVPLAWSMNGSEKVLLLLIPASLSWLAAYLIAHVCVIVLRIRRPHLERPFKTPIYPLPQIVGILGITYVIMNASPDPELAMQVYRSAGLLMLGTVIYSACWVRFKMKKRLFEPVSFEQAMSE